MLQTNRDLISGPGFSQVWSAILASMHIEVLPKNAQQLQSNELPRQEVVLAYWRQGLEVPLATLQARM